MVFLTTEKVETHVFCDAVEPRVERCVAAKGIDGTKRFKEGFLCEIFCSLSIFHLSENLVLDTGMVFDNKDIKGISFALLGAFDVDVFFGVCGQDDKRL